MSSGWRNGPVMVEEVEDVLLKISIFNLIAAGRLASDPTPLQNARKILKSQEAGVSKGWVGVGDRSELCWFRRIARRAVDAQWAIGDGTRVVVLS